MWSPAVVTGQAGADREILRVSHDRAGFAVFDTWLERQAEQVTLVTMESSGHYWMPLASQLRRRKVGGRRGQPACREVLSQEPDRPHEGRSGPIRGASPRWPCATCHPFAGAELRQAVHSDCGFGPEAVRSAPSTSHTKGCLSGGGRCQQDPPTSRARVRAFATSQYRPGAGAHRFIGRWCGPVRSGAPLVRPGY
jgi:hypothetical protein